MLFHIVLFYQKWLCSSNLVFLQLWSFILCCFLLLGITLLSLFLSLGQAITPYSTQCLFVCLYCIIWVSAIHKSMINNSLAVLFQYAVLCIDSSFLLILAFPLIPVTLSPNPPHAPFLGLSSICTCRTPLWDAMRTCMESASTAALCLSASNIIKKVASIQPTTPSPSTHKLLQVDEV